MNNVIVASEVDGVEHARAGFAEVRSMVLDGRFDRECDVASQAIRGQFRFSNDIIMEHAQHLYYISHTRINHLIWADGQDRISLSTYENMNKK